MSVSGSQFRFSGVASGLDVDSIINSLMTIENIPVARMQRAQAALQSQQASFAQFRSSLQSLAGSVANLASKSTYNPVSAVSSDSAVATVSATSNASAGVFSLEVTDLAQAHKLASTAQASASDALGLSGRVVINGKAMDVAATDSLSTVATRISGLGVGVTASVINGGTGQAYLSLNATSTGQDNAVQLADADGGVLASLGLVSGASTLRDSPSANTGRSYGFSDSTTSIGSLTGLTTSSGTVVLNGTSVALDFGTDSLQGIADKINAASTGIAATVVTSTVDGKTLSKLQLSGAGVPSAVTDTNGLLGQIGVFQQGFGNQLVAAQNASFKVDGLSLSSATNSVSSVIPGATITLLKKNSTATLSLNKDVSQIKSAITAVQSAYNSMVALVKQSTGYDAASQTSGSLFGDQTVQNIQQSLSDMLFSTMGTGKYTNLTQIGLGVDQNGNITVDDAKLSTALSTNLGDVQNLLMASGSGSTASLSFVSNGEKTLTSTGSGYDVNITQAATKSKSVGTLAQTTATSAGEVLTFGGAVFGGSTHALALDAGMTAADIVAKINSDTRLKDTVVASLDVDGKLQVDSKRYGASGRFTLASSQVASTNNSGLGTATSTDGLDVAGTINGETATGSGQYLLGAVGNARTESLQVQYTGTSTGVVGTVSFNRGAANTLRGKLSSFLDSVNGLLSISDKSLQNQVDDIAKSITEAQSNMRLKEDFFRAKFTAMETAMAALQSQSSQVSNWTSSQSKASQG